MNLKELSEFIKEKIILIIPGIQDLSGFILVDELFSALNSFLDSKQEEFKAFYQEFENKKLKIEKGRAIMLLMELVKKIN